MRRADRRAELAQDLVAGAMAETIVDALEAVDVEIDDAERRKRATRARALELDRAFEAAPVEQPGQTVAARQGLERAPIATHLRDQERR